MVPRVGVEPTRCHHHRILNPARLPIPPPRQGIGAYYNKEFFRYNRRMHSCQTTLCILSTLDLLLTFMLKSRTI